jgi:hypothetical protein
MSSGDGVVHRFGILAIVALLAAAPAARAANCPQAELGAAASAVQDARNGLLGLPPSAEPTLSRAAASAIANMKTRLAAFVLAYMHCQPENADVEGIEIDLSRLGWAQEQAPARGPLFSGTLVFETRVPAQGMIGITARFGIRCGSDTMLMLFEHSDAGWTESLRVAAPAYRDIAHAYQDFDYAVAPPDNDGAWFLVETHGAARCGPAPAGLSYSVLRPTRDAIRPKVLFAGHDAALGADTTLDLGSDYFALAAPGDAPRRFSVAGQTVAPQ